MKTITLSTTVVMLLTASATTLLANGPMGGSTSSSANTGSRSTGTGRTPRPKPMPNGYNGPGVTNCYDYAYACGTGTRPTGPMKGRDALINHSSVRSRTTYANPMAARGQYRPGDWLVTNGHSGYVNRRGGIDHYHMFSDGVTYRSGQRYIDQNNLPVEGPDGMGGLRTNDSLEDFLHSGDRYHPYRTGPMGGVQVLRRR